ACPVIAIGGSDRVSRFRASREYEHHQNGTNPARHPLKVSPVHQLADLGAPFRRIGVLKYRRADPFTIWRAHFLFGDTIFRLLPSLHESFISHLTRMVVADGLRHEIFGSVPCRP